MDDKYDFHNIPFISIKEKYYDIMATDIRLTQFFISMLFLTISTPWRIKIVEAIHGGITINQFNSKSCKIETLP